MIGLMSSISPLSILSKQLTILYNYIWSTTVATQMFGALYDKSEVKVRVGDHILVDKADCYAKIFDSEKGKCVEQKRWEQLFGNYLKIAEKDNYEEWKEQTVYLPDFEIGEEIQHINMDYFETFTKTPPRFGNGSAVMQ